MNRPKPWQCLTVALILIVLSGCRGPAPTATPVPATPTPRPTRVPPTATPRPTSTAPVATPTLEAGWVLYEKPADGFAIALPPTWRQIDMDPQTWQASLDAIKAQNPDLAPLLEGQTRSLLEAGIKFFGFDLAPEALATGVATNVNVLIQSLPAEVSLDFYVQLNVGQLENMPSVVKPVEHRRVQFADGEAEELRYAMNMVAPSGAALTLWTDQYLFVREKQVYVVTCTTSKDAASQYAETFAKIGQSFRLLP